MTVQPTPRMTVYKNSKILGEHTGHTKMLKALLGKRQASKSTSEAHNT